jgi:hypothetical protein
MVTGVSAVPFWLKKKKMVLDEERHSVGLTLYGCQMPAWEEADSAIFLWWQRRGLWEE